MAETFGCLTEVHKAKLNEWKNFLYCYQEKLGNISDHTTKAARAPEGFGQHSQEHCGIFGMSCAGPGVELHDPWECLPALDIP